MFICLQCWENGIILCRELADQYESYYDYRNLSKMRVSFFTINNFLKTDRWTTFRKTWKVTKKCTHRLIYAILLVCIQYIVLGFHCQMTEASLYDKIMDQQRLEPEFFRVGFYGKKFPFFLRVKKNLHTTSVS